MDIEEVKEVKDFSRALKLLNEGKRVYSHMGRNGQSEDTLMFITKQMPTPSSKMTETYLFMTIISKGKPDIVIPRTPSQKDLRTTDWRDGEQLALLENRPV